ncbi:MAG TPA: DNA-binding response regulator [Chloroflexus aurantiacus]|jgi:two-component system response regulator NreC|uniref:Response regulator receiver n=1 Tax=Chloroflexus aurantiacus (strain ATCC 29366 / DSM 635 / J-10-fl) TaxID=324602 RepID=A9WAP9_CHLAA|nr:response regulator transcription factor [Chloroflexus aurantiacus]ABY33277.1 response regulator receiver [Chloroflexus aurantiacus J-10-fl]RMG51225.1 MAG: DNA-binding response regulator [Chloroflexota bacterium]HBW66977.1 DNA-binding response regulator [Chloroflexus aurantiacus]
MSSILLVDDHAVLRAGLRLLLDGQPDLRVIGEAEDVRTAVVQATTLQPDLILLDLSLTGSSGLAAIPALRAVAPHSRILVLTMHDDEGYVRQALAAGANGYVLKRAADAELIAAIRAVLRGELYIHPALTRQLLEDLLPQTPALNPWESLSEREREVLLLVARGYTAAEIAEQLSLSPKTVETYRTRGMEKLGLRSRAALVQYALNHNLLTPT